MPLLGMDPKISLSRGEELSILQVCRPCFSLTGLDGNLRGLDILAFVIEKGS